MTWFTENWFWILTFIAFVAMHLFGHGGHGGHAGHGGHGGHGGGDRRPSGDAREGDGTQSRAVNNKAGGHQL